MTRLWVTTPRGEDTLYFLHIKALHGEERRIPLTPGRGTIGSAAGNTLVLEQFGVSARHAEIDVRGHGVVLRDLDSTNGTFVNGHRVTDVLLRAGDRILIGTVLLVFHEAISDRFLVRRGRASSVAARTAPRRAVSETPFEDRTASASAELERMRQALAAGAGWLVASTGPGRAVDIDDDLLGTSDEIRALLRRLERMAGETAPLLFYGEPGTEKEQAARRAHALGPRAAGPFLSLHCAAVAPDQLECALFGASEGPSGDRPAPGRLESLHGGSIFLDEVADLPGAVQERLLRRIEADGAPAGSALETRPQPDVRLLFGSGAPAETLVAGGTLLPALAERLRGRELRLAPLRERREDIVPLAQHLVRRHGQQLHRRILALSSEACDALVRYPWPGNLLELQDVMRRAVLLSRDGIIDVETLPRTARGASLLSEGAEGLGILLDLPWKEARLAFERIYLQGMLNHTGGNIAQSSRRAKLARKNFYAKLKHHGLVPRAK